MRRLYYLAGLILLAACNKYDIPGLFVASSPTSDKRFEASMAYNATAGYPSVTIPTENYHFYSATDIHIYHSTENLDKFVAALAADTESAPFWINLGDIVDGKDQMKTFDDHAKVAPQQMFGTPGNHDLYFGQWKQWQELYHTSSYWFEAILPSGAKDLYLSLDSGGSTLGRKQKAWAEEILAGAQGKYRHIIVFTHTHFFRKDWSQETTSNWSQEETMALTGLFAQSGVSLVLTGHDHFQERTTYMGVQYAVLEALKDGTPDPGYTRCDVGDQVALTFVPLE
jgi:2',3'-cyclic-nucleotide 2'-phosphodiesterase (5'-nucleotidase family)